MTDPGGDPTFTGRGATAVAQAGEIYTVTFNKDVSACSFTATASGADGAAARGRRRRRQHPGQRVVDTDAGAQPDTSFHLQVIC